MPRTARGTSGPLLVLGDGFEKQLRAARTEDERVRLQVPRRQELERVAPHALLTATLVQTDLEFCTAHGLTQVLTYSHHHLCRHAAHPR